MSNNNNTLNLSNQQSEKINIKIIKNATNINNSQQTTTDSQTNLSTPTFTLLKKNPVLKENSKEEIQTNTTQEYSNMSSEVNNYIETEIQKEETPITSSVEDESLSIPQEGNEIDDFILKALHGNERLTILKLDGDLEKFIKDPNMTKLEYPPMSSYHRLIIHRVAQYFRLEHSSIDHGGQKRSIILTKSKDSRIPTLRLCDLVEQEEPAPSKSVKILSRKNSSPSNHSTVEKKDHNSHHYKLQKNHSFDNNSSSSLSLPTPSASYLSDNLNSSPDEQDNKSSSVKSLEEREAEYLKARARIFSNDDPSNNSNNITPTNNNISLPPPSSSSTSSSSSSAPANHVPSMIGHSVSSPNLSNNYIQRSTSPSNQPVSPPHHYPLNNHHHNHQNFEPSLESSPSFPTNNNMNNNANFYNRDKKYAGNNIVNNNNNHQRQKNVSYDHLNNNNNNNITNNKNINFNMMNNNDPPILWNSQSVNPNSNAMWTMPDYSLQQPTWIENNNNHNNNHNHKYSKYKSAPSPEMNPNINNNSNSFVVPHHHHHNNTHHPPSHPQYPYNIPNTKRENHSNNLSVSNTNPSIPAYNPYAPPYFPSKNRMSYDYTVPSEQFNPYFENNSNNWNYFYPNPVDPTNGYPNFYPPRHIHSLPQLRRDYERPPPKSTVLFDPNAPQQPSRDKNDRYSKSMNNNVYYIQPKKINVSDHPPVQLDKPIAHILEITGVNSPVSPDDNLFLELREGGAKIKILEDNTILAIFKNSAQANKALETLKSPHFSLQTWSKN